MSLYKAKLPHWPFVYKESPIITHIYSANSELAKVLEQNSKEERAKHIVTKSH